jgi:hypothetical protein
MKDQGFLRGFTLTGYGLVNHVIALKASAFVNTPIYVKTSMDRTVYRKFTDQIMVPMDAEKGALISERLSMAD